MANRASFISVNSTTTYASSFSDNSGDSPSLFGANDPIPSHYLLTVDEMQAEDNRTPYSTPIARRDGRPLREGVRGPGEGGSYKEREKERERRPTEASTPQRSTAHTNGHVKHMIDRLNPDSSTPSRPTRAPAGQTTDPSRITQRPSKAQLRTKASTAQLTISAPTSRKPSPIPRQDEVGAQGLWEGAGGGAERKHRFEAVRPGTTHMYSEPMVSMANPLNVRTGTSQVAKPRRPMDASGPTHLGPPAVTAQPTSPARSESTLAEEWEAELVRNAKTFRTPPASSRLEEGASTNRQAGDNARQRDRDWERMGTWEYSREEGRQEEERARRDASRAIAYPPSLPRVPIRAAAIGVTSVHIGVRPRIHPSRADDCLARNQPDESLPEPLFSPVPSPHLLTPNGEAPPSTAPPSHRSTEQYQRAQKEYEDWLSRKAEREGGIAQHGATRNADGDKGDDSDYGSGSREWVPREREQARFGYMYGQDAYPASLGKGHASEQAAAMWAAQGPGHGQGQGQGQEHGAYGPGNPYIVHPGNGMGHGYAGGQMGGVGPAAGEADAYGGYPYWDPAAYWWATQMGLAQMGMAGMDVNGMGIDAGMGMQGMQGMPMDGAGAGSGWGQDISPFTSDESSKSGSSGGVAAEHANKVHFAPSPDKTLRDEAGGPRPRRRQSMLGLNVKPAQQGHIIRTDDGGSNPAAGPPAQQAGEAMYDM